MVEERPYFSLPYSGIHEVTQWFGERPDYYPEYSGHPGIDFDLREYQPVYSIGPGVVIHAGRDEGWPGRGKYIVVDHGGFLSYYMHLSATYVVAGDRLTSPIFIGESGNTGHSTGPHLHLGIRKNSLITNDKYSGWVDPAPLLGLRRE